MKACNSCEFFDPSFSKCRRYPPKSESSGPQFPPTEWNLWCGEFKEREKAHEEVPSRSNVDVSDWDYYNGR